MTILDELRGKEFPVLDDGHVILIDAGGSDQRIIDAARVTRGKGTRKVTEDRALLRYLFRHRHATPFEMADITLHVRVPMDCWRQWIRHRTASVNEYSTRYSEAIDSAQRTNPAQWRTQSATNKQGSASDELEWPEWATEKGDWPSPGSYLSDREKEFQVEARQLYEERLQFGIAREQARKDLPLSTYTEAYWKCNIRNVLHFLGLRMDPHAQHEIRQYARVIGEEIVARLFPWTWEAFLDYELNAMRLSDPDVQAIGWIMREIRSELGDFPEGIRTIISERFGSQRERDEFVAKATRLDILP
jgi:thymidylate synthase (FAD)